jgi:Eukaryotic cytochrome b561
MHDGQPWPAVGHGLPQGSDSFNPFGADFRAAGKVWTTELCQTDSDGDGMTNGQELGDPDCVWTPGSTPTRVVDITHPGFETTIIVDDTTTADTEQEVDPNANAAATAGDGSSSTLVEEEPLSLPSWLVTHIVCMMLSWGFFLPIGALMAISFRGVFSNTARWFTLHVGIQLLGVALSIAGFVVAFVNIATHFKDTHHIVGTVVFAGGLYQALQGFVRPHKPEKGQEATTLRKMWEFCHKGFGRIVIVLAWINIFLGVKLVKKFFTGVPEELTSTIFLGMNVILGVQTALCLLLTVVALCVRTTPKDAVEDDTGSGDLKHTSRPNDFDDDEEQASA